MTKLVKHNTLLSRPESLQDQYLHALLIMSEPAVATKFPKKPKPVPRRRKRVNFNIGFKL